MDGRHLQFIDQFRQSSTVLWHILLSDRALQYMYLKLESNGKDIYIYITYIIYQHLQLAGRRLVFITACQPARRVPPASALRRHRWRLCLLLLLSLVFVSNQIVIILHKSLIFQSCVFSLSQTWAQTHTYWHTRPCCICGPIVDRSLSPIVSRFSSHQHQDLWA